MKKRKAKASKITEGQLRSELRHFVALCSASLEELTVYQIAEEANLAPQTIINLFSGHTKNPRFMTVQKVGIVAGFTLHLTKSRVIMRVAS